MKEIDPKKRRIGTDATLKTTNKVVQLVKESPARSALLGLTGFIFLKTFSPLSTLQLRTLKSLLNLNHQRFQTNKKKSN